MKNRPVLFIDSGIGGIPYCSHFIKEAPGENIVYLADRKHFPYGKREKKELVAIVTRLVGQLISEIDPKIAVLACNTATLAALAELRESFPGLPFVGTVPAIKPAALASKTGKIGILGTQFTINQPYIWEIATQFGGDEICGIAAPELVEFIENDFNTAPASKKKSMAQGYLDRFRAAEVDTLVLGCTHFLFLQDDFQREAAPDIAVFDSVAGITRRIMALSYSASQSSSSPSGNETAKAQNRLLLTGGAAPEPSWVSWAYRLGFSLSLLQDLE
jgi:glutamate racemase